MSELKTSQASLSSLAARTDPTTSDLSYIGLGEIAYVRSMETKGLDVYGIFAANGEPLATMNGRDSAMAATIQNDLVPVSVH